MPYGYNGRIWHVDLTQGELFTGFDGIVIKVKLSTVDEDYELTG